MAGEEGNFRSSLDFSLETIELETVVFYYRVEPYKHNNYMVIDNHTEI
jgi:hypothetical protein